MALPWHLKQSFLMTGLCADVLKTLGQEFHLPSLGSHSSMMLRKGRVSYLLLLEMSRDLTNIEHRTEAAGSTWAGVCSNYRYRIDKGRAGQEEHVHTSNNVKHTRLQCNTKHDECTADLFNGGWSLRKLRSVGGLTGSRVLLLLRRVVFPQQQVKRCNSHTISHQQLRDTRLHKWTRTVLDWLYFHKFSEPVKTSRYLDVIINLPF